jgi:hypothetical protein
MNSAGYFCRKCGSEIRDTDTICPKCNTDLHKTGRMIEVSINESLRLSDSVTTTLTKTEQTTLKSIQAWLRENISQFELTEIEVGFPSGVKIKFTKKAGISR